MHTLGYEIRVAIFVSLLALSHSMSGFEIETREAMQLQAERTKIIRQRGEERERER